MKTLVIVAHPNLNSSVVNKNRVEALAKHPEDFTVHRLYDLYPDEQIDVKNEQALIESHGSLVLQFPVQWFSCPPLMKKWFEEVITDGWAYGGDGDKMLDRKVGLALTAGISEKNYSPTGKYKYTLKEALTPIEMTINYTKAAYQGFSAFYRAKAEFTALREKESLEMYFDFLRSM